MKVAAVIAEYNPFHEGHRYHISRTRQLTGCDGVMAIMSGNFVQRGEPAILEKRERARAAVMSGVDLVIELPCVWSSASAERFASAAVYLAVQSGAVDFLSFGCETDDVALMTKAARIFNDKVYSSRIKEYYDKNLCSYPFARAAVAREQLGDEAYELLKGPNNILAVEYIKALLSFKSKIVPVAVKRLGAEHDAPGLSAETASAMSIRNALRAGADASGALCPETLDVIEKAKELGRFPALYSRLETAVLADLRRMKPHELALAPDVSEGIEYRILEAAKSSCSLTELFDKVKTKRYTHARIRRIILASFLGITKADASSLPPYIRVLAFNETGRLILRAVKENAVFPVVTKYSDVKYLSDSARNIFMLESRAADIFSLALPKVRECGTDMTESAVYVSK